MLFFKVVGDIEYKKGYTVTMKDGDEADKDLVKSELLCSDPKSFDICAIFCGDGDWNGYAWPSSCYKGSGWSRLWRTVAKKQSKIAAMAEVSYNYNF